ncbi:DsbA family protein [Agrilutibacter solisilvae]|uniref:Thioredoxin domain-containing protein n=1 Tax=Agrilutibacter solisilvae TaxID=2763317 RepID=A0A974Y0C0_9GAMM|nr:thioredoxin domain-containing protein [Lysobacter solisilvae]QSX78928.1 thioredoxin domain-containing protein [Lysobacter solisilvae]
MASLKVPVTTSDHILGASSGAVTLVEYGDYQCPHCAAAQLPVKQILSHYGGRICLVFRHFPLTEVHPMAGMAAETAEFAGGYGRFWEMHDAIFANQPRLSPELLLTLVSALELPAEEFQEALASGLHAPKVQAHFMGGVRSGVNGTPTFFVNGVRHDADYTFADLASSIDDAMLAMTR